MTTRKQAPRVAAKAYKRWDATVTWYAWRMGGKVGGTRFVPYVQGSNLELWAAYESICDRYNLPTAEHV